MVTESGPAFIPSSAPRPPAPAGPAPQPTPLQLLESGGLRPPFVRALRSKRQWIDYFVRTGKPLDNKMMDYLLECLHDTGHEDIEALNWLLWSRSPNMLVYAQLAWRHRVAALARDAITIKLREYFVQAGMPELAGDRIRSDLANESAAIRIEAASILGDIGDLNDIGLFSDLLSLPPATDENPQERSEMVAVMQKISRMEQ